MSITETLQVEQSDWQLRKREVTAILRQPPRATTKPDGKMLDYTNFHAVFPQGATPYNSKDNQEIETLRKSFGGVLFIDQVLDSLRIGAGKTPCRSAHCFDHYNCAGRIYPPRGENGLRALHRQICESKVSTHHKLSVFYYLLLDYDLARGHTSAVADDFVVKSGLPRKYHLMMRGLWHMDRKEFKVRHHHPIPRMYMVLTVV
jgi:hypothetical protein